MARSDDIAKYRDYYGGVTKTITDGFYARFGDQDKATADRIGANEIPVFNAAKAALLDLMSLIPTKELAWQVFDKSSGEQDKKKTDWLLNWLSEPNFDGREFIAFHPDAIEDAMIDGEIPLKMIMINGVPAVRVIDDQYFKILTSLKNIFNVIGYEAEYTVTNESNEDKSSVNYKETITEDGYETTQDGIVIKEMSGEYNFGFIPVLLIKRKRIKNDTHGESALADLIEQMDNITRCQVNVARANRYAGWGLYCVRDQSLPVGETLSLKPGSLIRYPIDNVAKAGASEELFKERNDNIDYLYDLAGMKRTTQDQIGQTPNTSGKALVTLNGKGRRQVEKMIANLEAGWSLMAQYALKMAGKVERHDDIFVTVSYPSLDQDDPQAIVSKAQMLFGEGFANEALRVLGYKDDQINNLTKERETTNLFLAGADSSESDNEEPIKQEGEEPEEDSSA